MYIISYLLIYNQRISNQLRGNSIPFARFFITECYRKNFSKVERGIRNYGSAPAYGTKGMLTSVSRLCIIKDCSANNYLIDKHQHYVCLI